MRKLAIRSRRIAVIAAAAGLLLVQSPAAHADTNDPLDSGCWGNAYVVANIARGQPNIGGDTGYGQLYLWYSNSCNTNWAEFINYPSGHEFSLMAWSGYGDLSGGVQIENWYSTGDEVAWTDMVNGTPPAGVAVCEDYSRSSVAYLMQDGASDFPALFGHYGFC